MGGIGPYVEPIIDREDYGKMIGRLPFDNVPKGERRFSRSRGPGRGVLLEFHYGQEKNIW
jgi:hypothetical protein